MGFGKVGWEKILHSAGRAGMSMIFRVLQRNLDRSLRSGHGAPPGRQGVQPLFVFFLLL